eukprot:CAMPEP_0197031004 /NCGR_PEP_ID=MMETSP1384-20130603/10125_1 /TAXON_ID=29189 /ORGANISM="Ammonia sp." /LENGTH=69 /DNA_ID=CAMNT_0042460465 /DNA_START=27 /DNA_END=233 /DNA_ORIENTATION=+
MDADSPSTDAREEKHYDLESGRSDNLSENERAAPERNPLCMEFETSGKCGMYWIIVILFVLAMIYADLH